MRYIFFGIVILIIILFFVLLDQFVYRVSKLFTEQHTALMISRWFSSLLILCIIISTTYGYLVTRWQIQVNRTEVATPSLPSSFDGFRIVQISDMHLDWFDSDKGHTFLGKVIDSIDALHPDIIFFTGDLVTIQAEEAEPFRTELSKLSKYPVYSILGNHDYADYTRMTLRERALDIQQLCRLQEDCGWHLLRNEHAWIHRGEDSIAVIGVENIGEPPFSVYGDLKKARQGTEGSWSILLSHNPTHWRKEVLPDTDIALMLAGHTHAVQVQFGSWSPAKWKYPEWASLYQKGEQFLYVNSGLGGVGPRVRIGVKPEITLITLRRTAD